MKLFSRFLLLLLVSLLVACTGIPDRVQPVSHFELSRYLGKWYEIARLDHSFERGLSKVTAEYSLREDGGVRVINRGYHAKDQNWSEAEGKAYFVNTADKGYLKVSFFGPFYGAYIVIALDADYQHALVSGPDKSYLWVLSRTQQMPSPILDEFIAKAKSLGYPTEELIYVDH